MSGRKVIENGCLPLFFYILLIFYFAQKIRRKIRQAKNFGATQTDSKPSIFITVGSPEGSSPCAPGTGRVPASL